jgi:3-phosphoglycerate kinase
MAFEKGKSGNPNGRPKKTSVLDKPTNRDLKERELIMLLRKIKPHVAKAISQAAEIMQNEEASHQNQLKAATILLDNYRRLTLDVYDGEDADDKEGTEIQQQNAPLFSLTVIDNEKAA